MVPCQKAIEALRMDGSTTQRNTIICFHWERKLFVGLCTVMLPAIVPALSNGFWTEYNSYIPLHFALVYFLVSTVSFLSIQHITITSEMQGIEGASVHEVQQFGACFSLESMPLLLRLSSLECSRLDLR